MAAGRSRPRACAPRRSPRRSARASRPPTTCSPACARRASPRTAPAASTAWRSLFRELVAGASAAPALHDLSGIVRRPARPHAQALLRRRRARRRAAHRLERGLQGMPKLPGLSPQIRDNAHALALGKVVLALARPRRVERYLQPPAFSGFTAHTITDPDVLRVELRGGPPPRHAPSDREEFEEDFCCIAAPVRDPRGRFARGRRHLDDAPGLRRRARDARADGRGGGRRSTFRARIPAHLPNTRRVLDPRVRPGLASAT